jgi:hypothetical protein
MIPLAFQPPRSRLRVEPILRFHRYRSLDQVAPAIREVAEEMVRVAQKLVEPEVAFVTRSLSRVTPDSVTLAAGPTCHGRCLGTHLASAVEVACFVATVGPALDDRVSEMADRHELLEALFLDSAGWLAVEDALRAFRVHLSASVRPRGFRLGPRLGPGYMDWSLTEQQEFFAVFDGAPLPVRLNDYCVMIPRKSLSGLFGLIPTS